MLRYNTPSSLLTSKVWMGNEMRAKCAFERDIIVEEATKMAAQILAKKALEPRPKPKFVYVGNLNPATTEGAIRWVSLLCVKIYIIKFFHGDVEVVNILPEKKCAFVGFASVAGMEAAIKKSGKMLGGKKLKIEAAKKKNNKF